MLIFRVPVWRNVTSYQHPVAHHVEASGLFWVSRKHSRLVFVAVAHPAKLFNWGDCSLTAAFRSRRMIHLDPNEHDCNTGLNAAVRLQSPQLNSFAGCATATNTRRLCFL